MKIKNMHLRLQSLVHHGLPSQHNKFNINLVKLKNHEDLIVLSINFRFVFKEDHETVDRTIVSSTVEGSATKYEIKVVTVINK